MCVDFWVYDVYGLIRYGLNEKKRGMFPKVLPFEYAQSAKEKKETAPFFPFFSVFMNNSGLEVNRE